MYYEAEKMYGNPVLRQYICIFQNFMSAKIQSTCTVAHKHICQEMPIYINTQIPQGIMNIMDWNKDFLI